MEFLTELKGKAKRVGNLWKNAFDTFSLEGEEGTSIGATANAAAILM
jgi:hypothetical protein